MLKILPIFLFMLIMQTSNAQQTKIIAHRGAWKEFNLPENSIASLDKAIEYWKKAKALGLDSPTIDKKINNGKYIEQ